MNAPVWVLPELVLVLHQRLLAEHGGMPGIRDPERLESALALPRVRAACENKFRAFELAASYCHGLARNQPFVDGNKRIAFMVSAVFLELNGYSLIAPEAEVVLALRQLESGLLSENSLADWYRESCVALA